MERYVFRSLFKECEEEKVRSELCKHFDSLKAMVDNGSLMTVSLFKQSRSLFLYYEITEKYVSPVELFPLISSLLEERPDENEYKCWIPMNDIFHFSNPVSVDHWRRKEAVKERVGKIARIKQHMLSSYIYYHYLLQEGHSATDNKYCLIGLDENLIFYYEELPKTAEDRQTKGNFNTSHLPHNWQDIWQDIMEPHFIYWDESPENERKLRPCELIFGC
jgi:hypothetical protein